jgi:carboxyl-terminal processing protease
MVMRVFSAIVFTFLVSLVWGQPLVTRCRQANALIKVYEKYHVKPKPIDNVFTNSVINNLIRILDTQGLYLLQSDVDKIRSQKAELSEYINTKSCNFPDFVESIYKQRLIEADTLISQITAKPFNLAEKDSISFDLYDSLHFANSLPELRTKWERLIKFYTLKQLYGKNQKDSVLAKGVDTSYASQLLESMVLIKSKRHKEIQRKLNKQSGFTNYVANIVLNSIALEFDPHSNFFTEEDKQMFEDMLSKEFFSFGFVVDVNKSDELVIKKIKLGGPAWKSKKLSEGDFLLEASTPDKKYINFLGADIYEALDFLLSKNTQTINLKVRNKKGEVKTVKLNKKKMDVEFNHVSSYILKGEKKIGYIALPDFYMGDQNSKASNCSNDVAKEILKLMNEKIDGLIIDIRNNGGGALNEAFNIAGLFIDEGPLCVSRDNASRLYTLKDSFRGTIYDGPILLMVNSFSASASEILASTLQDYNRAIIFGATTYGKATAQVIIPLESNVNPRRPNEMITNTDMGFVKLTVNKLYRVNGATYQRIGVIPDIQMDFPYNNLNRGEKGEATALSNDTINKKLYPNISSKLPVDELKRRSDDRVKKGERFIKISEINKDFSNRNFFTQGTSLSKDGFIATSTKILNVMDQMDQLTVQPSPNYQVNFLLLNSDRPKDSNQEEIVAEEKKKIHEDIFIDEAYSVLNDLINIENPKLSRK